MKTNTVADARSHDNQLRTVIAASRYAKEADEICYWSLGGHAARER